MNNLIVKEYLGNGISFKNVNGEIYANATEMCKGFGKKTSHWLENKSTSELIKEVSSEVGIPTGGLVITENGVGSWVHEELILELAGWLNIKFRRWCQKQIATLIREGEVSLKPKSEEDMLLELFPSSSKDLIVLTAENIRAVKKLELTVTHKTNLIDNLTSDLDSVRLRLIATEYVNKTAKSTGRPHAKIYSDIYTLLGRSLKTDIRHKVDKYKESQKRLVKENKLHNKEQAFKGVNKLRPCTLGESDANISIIEYVCNVMKQGKVLLEVMAKVFEIDINDIVEKYNYIK